MPHTGKKLLQCDELLLLGRNFGLMIKSDSVTVKNKLTHTTTQKKTPLKPTKLEESKFRRAIHQ